MINGREAVLLIHSKQSLCNLRVTVSRIFGKPLLSRSKKVVH